MNNRNQGNLTAATDTPRSNRDIAKMSSFSRDPTEGKAEPVSARLKGPGLRAWNELKELLPGDTSPTRIIDEAIRLRAIVALAENSGDSVVVITQGDQMNVRDLLRDLTPVKSCAKP